MLCGEKGLALVKSFESCELSAYRDQRGILTIGFGQTGPMVSPDLDITQEVADAWLAQSIAALSAALSRMIKLPINQNQFDSFCSLAFNIGQTAFANSSALAMFNEGFTDLVPAKIALWCKITDPTTGEKIIDAGLVRRRSAEIVLYNTPA